MRQLLLLVLSAITLLTTSCKKNNKYSMPSVAVTIAPDAKKILVDATKGNGIGSDLTLYLHQHGFVVTELDRSRLITTGILNEYGKIIRTAPATDYRASELEAYAKWLKGSNSLLLFPRDVTSRSDDDNLCKLLGLKFSENVGGNITNLTAHEMTAGVSVVEINSGAAIANANAADVLSLASGSFYNDDMNAIFEGTIFGIAKHPTSKIVFLSDIAAIQKTPQPITDNIIKWLFK